MARLSAGSCLVNQPDHLLPAKQAAPKEDVWLARQAVPAACQYHVKFVVTFADAFALVAQKPNHELSTSTPTLHDDNAMPPPSASPPREYPLPAIPSTGTDNGDYKTTTAAATTADTSNAAPRVRLNLHPLTRLALGATFAFSTIFVATALRRTHTASLQFRAENAHRLPRSQKGWFFYHRSRSYAAMRDGVAAGVKRGSGMAGYVALFVAVEEAVDAVRGKVDFGGSVVAGGVTGGWFGVTTALMLRNGLWYGFLFGAAQDLLVALRGDSVAWIDPFVGRARATKKEHRRGNVLATAGSLQDHDR
ncbi:hypothetical protein Dda_2577 [Drechslerella dactyloides]|uniref:Uncharacterized protein n=1 Tax=Drechslerella dactyloides TaxID=74499 RepID=A0AAD6IZR6_DREDA|nr:hypothetical protein Dda_2577 [Drechslerella dactyloides]